MSLYVSTPIPHTCEMWKYNINLMCILCICILQRLNLEMLDPWAEAQFC